MKRRLLAVAAWLPLAALPFTLRPAWLPAAPPLLLVVCAAALAGFAVTLYSMVDAASKRYSTGHTASWIAALVLLAPLATPAYWLLHLRRRAA